MAVKCTECGASIQDDSKFCKYCGAKIVQEDVKRIEVKVDNTAEIKRASYEEEESKLRQKAMKRDLRMKGLKWKITAALNIAGTVLLAVGLAFGPGWLGAPGVLLLLGPYLFMFVKWMG